MLGLRVVSDSLLHRDNLQMFMLSLLLLSASLFSLSPHCPRKPQLENGPHAPVYQLLNLFAYGTYCDYKGIFSTGTV